MQQNSAGNERRRTSRIRQVTRDHACIVLYHATWYLGNVTSRHQLGLNLWRERAIVIFLFLSVGRWAAVFSLSCCVDAAKRSNRFCSRLIKGVRGRRKALTGIRLKLILPINWRRWRRRRGEEKTSGNVSQFLREWQKSKSLSSTEINLSVAKWSSTSPGQRVRVNVSFFAGTDTSPLVLSPLASKLLLIRRAKPASIHQLDPGGNFCLKK